MPQFFLPEKWDGVNELLIEMCMESLHGYPVS